MSNKSSIYNKIYYEKIIAKIHKNFGAYILNIFFLYLVKASRYSKFMSVDLIVALSKVLLSLVDVFCLEDNLRNIKIGITVVINLLACENEKRNGNSQIVLLLAELYHELGDNYKARKLLEDNSILINYNINLQIIYAKIIAENEEYNKALSIINNVLSSGVAPSVAYTIKSNIMPFVGEFKEKWALYDKVNRNIQVKNDLKMWKGEDLKGKKLIVYNVSGLGDEIRMAAIYEHLIFKADKIQILTDPRLVNLFQRSFYKASIVPWNRRYHYSLSKYENNSKSKIYSGYDYYTIALNAPQYLFNCADDCRSNVVIRPDDRLVEKYKKWLNDLPKSNFYVGVDWKSGLRLLKRRKEYLDLIEWSPILLIPDICFISLNYSGTAEVEKVVKSLNIPIYTPPLDLKNDIEGLASVICNLDLVISAPTATAELSGFLSVPTFLIESSSSLHYRWRVATDGKDIWFKSITHFNSFVNGNSRKNIMKAREAVLSYMDSKK